ncbi:uncharacterized protein LOC129569695 isoform X2 [Sitodiplosis mosellana]|uniref:uncharacterized protein LOC129569695 isoform X2 n=1 Tax=Sitodiplosis mosellana TaxID=263140 RepID=UPI002443EBD4|nr:uncharacterized protein LOC129569695 isoform X2 [Sitodiplosis mosellana]
MLRERRRHANFKPNRKLDRKSSRGMIYENEELRLRTININAEVERGQSDIKKLLRENYRLRSENWTLRDEYDRLDKLLKTKSQPNGHSTKGSHDYRGDFKFGCDYDDSYRCYNCLTDEDGIFCDMCNENERYAKEFDDQKPSNSTNGDKVNGYESTKSNKCGPALMPAPIRNEKINMNFDHLSVVSEECLSNSDDQTNQNNKSDNEPSETAIDPIYANFQSTIPPLKHFENLSYKDIGPNVDSLGEIHFDGEMYQANEPTPPPPSPPPSVQAMNRRSTSLPLPPPPILTDEGNIVHLESPDNETGATEKLPKYFFAPLKSKRKSSMCSEMRPDVFVNNVVPSDASRVATIRKPHNPLKYPSNLNIASIDPEASSQLEAKEIQGLSKGVESMQMQSNRLYENVTSTDSDQSPPFRSDLSLVLSYSGNKSKYSTTQNSEKTQDFDVDTPPPNVPLAMKLLPNKLTYAGKTEFKPIGCSSQEVEQSIANVENSANEEILSKSQVNSTYESNECNGKVTKTKEKVAKNGEKHEDGTNGDSTSPSASKEKEANSNSKTKKRDSNDSQDSKETGGSSKNSHENKDQNGRCVSIHFNGKPITNQQETEPHSNDSDLNNAADTMTEEEILAIPPVAYLRSRRSSCARKVNDEIGAFLYPPNPFAFGAYKRGRRPSFLSRRHSDGLIATQPTQYLDYELMAKNSNRCQCHRGHNNHLGVDPYCGEYCTNMGMQSGTNLGGSTGSSIGLNMTSSRESLGNISQQSTSRRKMSITSHSKSGGKIPWCACWGNGCI